MFSFQSFLSIFGFSLNATSSIFNQEVDFFIVQQTLEIFQNRIYVVHHIYFANHSEWLRENIIFIQQNVKVRFMIIFVLSSLIHHCSKYEWMWIPNSFNFEQNFVFISSYDWVIANEFQENDQTQNNWFEL